MTSNATASDSAALDSEGIDRIRARLQVLYGDRAGQCLRDLVEVIEKYPRSHQPNDWSERDAVLITYGDQVQDPPGTALHALSDFLTSRKLTDLINTVHILPFYPYSSDDGFSVIDYRQVNPEIGGWDDVRELAEHVGLMFDLVLNHCSQHSRWFQGYLAGEEPFTRFFHEVDPSTDLSRVTRPRSLPLLTEYETSRGKRHVWTTFSGDQVDLNFAEPAVLVEFIDILLFFISQGARIIRLDAIAYLWKEVGTNCIHLPQTHEVVKLMRDVLSLVAPHVLLISETNVPHKENVSYFGNGDEAHMVYQFSLPPLLLAAFLFNDATPLRDWLDGLDSSPPGTTFFNFTASHDGVGVRPLEGLVSPECFDQLVAAAKQRGGLVGTKRNPDGTDTPYELNITYVDALGEPDGMKTVLHARRFLSSQAVMLALPGVPGIYFHSLVGTRNDYAGVESSGIPRRINRHKFQQQELHDALSDPESLQVKIFAGYQQLLRTRINQPAFHPDGACKLVDFDNPALFAFERTSCDQSQKILCVSNVAGHAIDFSCPLAGQELLTGRDVASGLNNVEPYGTLWIAFKS